MTALTDELSIYPESTVGMSFTNISSTGDAIEHPIDRERALIVQHSVSKRAHIGGMSPHVLEGHGLAILLSYPAAGGGGGIRYFPL